MHKQFLITTGIVITSSFLLAGCQPNNGRDIKASEFATDSAYSIGSQTDFTSDPTISSQAGTLNLQDGSTSTNESVSLQLQQQNAQNQQAKQPQNQASQQRTNTASTQSEVGSTEGPNMSVKTQADFKNIDANQVTLKTNKGDIVLELYPDKAPVTVANFLDLVDSGYYDGIAFHRVIENFMAQFGDPLTKQPGQEALWGTGGPGYTIPDEFDPSLRHDKAGVLSMANRGPNTGGSQLFITYEPTPWLDDKHAVFGQVTSGMDVVEQITVGDVITSATYQKN